MDWRDWGCWGGREHQWSTTNRHFIHWASIGVGEPPPKSARVTSEYECAICKQIRIA